MSAAYIYLVNMANTEQTFSDLKKKDVINLIDGRNLGRVCDITFTFPENNVQGFTVTGSKGFRFNRQEIFIPIQAVTKIGEDAVLVKLGKENKPETRPPHNGDCPPQNFPPNCPPNCPPPNNCPPWQGGNPPPHTPQPPQPRRSYDEYE